MDKEMGRVPPPLRRRPGVWKSAKAILDSFSGIALVAFTLWLIIRVHSYITGSIYPTTALGASSSSPLATESDGFSWKQITPTKYMNYTPCFGKFQCARLDVPMDWNETGSDGPRVTVAIIRLPAPVSVVDPRYGGIILLNPVNQALNSAEKISTIVNPGTPEIFKSDEKYFDVVSFDPRGVNNTTPVMKCFPDSSSYDIWNYQQESEGIGSNTAISNMWARSKAVTAECSESGEIAHHMNTPVVVADMVEIIEKNAEWRSKEAKSWLASTQGRSITSGAQNDRAYSEEAILERTRWRKGEEKIQYWGFSYGTVLGATFAALQPHRVERVILDGVEDSTDYYSTAWALNLKDTDKIMDRFYEYCSAAGPKKCAFNFGTSDPADIKESFETLILDIKEDPIAVPATSSRGPEIITYSDVMLLIRYTVYKPLALFPQLADLLADLKSNGSAFADYKADHNKPSCPLQECSKKGGKEPCYPDDGGETSAAIMCSDGADISEPTKEHFKEYQAALYKDSRWLGEYWSGIAVKCYHWRAKAVWRVKGEDIMGNTSHPILWIGNTLDPVTPMSNAHRMAKKFPGSVVLQQDSEGHCSLASPSLCTGKYVREYFQTGRLPAPDIVCQPDELPLLGNVTERVQGLTANDERLLAAMKDLTKDMTTSKALGFW